MVLQALGVREAMLLRGSPGSAAPVLSAARAAKLDPAVSQAPVAAPDCWGAPAGKAAQPRKADRAVRAAMGALVELAARDAPAEPQLPAPPLEAVNLRMAALAQTARAAQAVRAARAGVAALWELEAMVPVAKATELAAPAAAAETPGAPKESLAEGEALAQAAVRDLPGHPARRVRQAAMASPANLERTASRRQAQAATEA